MNLNKSYVQPIYSSTDSLSQSFILAPIMKSSLKENETIQ